MSKSNVTSSLHGPNKSCSKFPVRATGGLIPIRYNKIRFESEFLRLDEKDQSTTFFHFPKKFDESEYPFFNSTFRPNTKEILFYCDWTPALFGIDEDEIPPSDDEELFEVDIEELRERAENLKESDLAMLRRFNESMTDDELREAWIENNIPRYAKRVRAKPILERDYHEQFECICDIDLFYCRHHIPRFSEGVKEGEELRIPHFRAFWDEFRERTEVKDEDRWSAILEKPPQEVEEPSDNPFRSFFNKSYGMTDVKRLRKKLLASFRPLDCREVRRYRMPFAEALYLELQEDGYQEVALFFKYLLIRDYFIHEAPENTNPTLRNSKGKLLKLVAFLKLADRFSRTEEYHKEAKILLRTAKYYNDHDKNWWWLAEELYTRAVKVSEKSVIDGGRTEAVSRFMLGMFLLDYASSAEAAQEHFSKARELSMGKDWTADKFLDQKQESLYRECVNYLCRVLIIQSKELRKSGKPNEALPLIHRSYKLCLESITKRDIEMETYFELGMTYQEVGFFNWAKTAFRNFIKIAKEDNYERRICDGYLELAICNRSEGDLDKAHQNLLSYLHLAEARGDENLIAYGHRYLGEFHLHNGNSAEAAEYFRKSFTSFCNQLTEAAEIPFEEWKLEHFMLVNEIELTRCLRGLAQGKLLTKPICQLILSAKDSKNQAETLKLIQWKDRGEVNFDLDSEHEDSSMASIEMWNVVTDMSTVTQDENMEESNADASRSVRFAEESKEKPILL